MLDELPSDPPTDMIQDLSFILLELNISRCIEIVKKTGSCNTIIASRQNRQPGTKKQLHMTRCA